MLFFLNKSFFLRSKIRKELVTWLSCKCACYQAWRPEHSLWNSSGEKRVSIYTSMFSSAPHLSTGLALFYVNLTQVLVILEEGTTDEKVNPPTGLACGQAHSIFSWLMIDVGKPFPQRWVDPGWVVLGGIRAQLSKTWGANRKASLLHGFSISSCLQVLALSFFPMSPEMDDKLQDKITAFLHQVDLMFCQSNRSLRYAPWCVCVCTGACICMCVHKKVKMRILKRENSNN